MLSRFLILCLALCLWAVSPLPSFAASPFAGERPTNLGVEAGLLAPCPSTPNCVVSQGGDGEHQIAPITYVGDRQQAYQAVVQVLGVVPRTEIITQTENYLRAESRSRLFGFVDDVEFYFPETEPVIQMRSASRLGESDLGVNRRRLEQIRLALQDLGIAQNS
ncbi:MULTISPECIES: DUF1499 domain-containing protein [Cyanophyceae]|uniref:DUF1499 domain-containing protein n=1 Tax=Cyanophyceae TaxID=3028117 RepID=UPI00016DC7AB|nr:MULTISPECIES: DUF1499 domain-containing protein [unclassified Picosynechococcus]ACA98490.1 conserved hypothetical protein (DUF1499) [Picosynechococcus sp. PCC 7002]SMH41990.1 Uncharacterized conserved protein, DUF1499 family [Picosynechococcus sp. OG1]SMQ78661.1 Uncharacterized conserved protein, DUF1499 family [Synechococcus sp. 7002]